MTGGKRLLQQTWEKNQWVGMSGKECWWKSLLSSLLFIGPDSWHRHHTEHGNEDGQWNESLETTFSIFKHFLYLHLNYLPRGVPTLRLWEGRKRIYRQNCIMQLDAGWESQCQRKGTWHRESREKTRTWYSHIVEPPAWIWNKDRCWHIKEGEIISKGSEIISANLLYFSSYLSHFSIILE